MQSLGRIVKLQIQLDRLKWGEEPKRIYDPSPIREVRRLWMRPEGLTAPAPDGGFLLDVHHSAHPNSRNREGENAISFGFTESCAQVRDRFGVSFWNGIAGESVLLEGPCPRPEELDGGVLVRGASGREWRLHAVIPAPPCAPFARFLMGRPEGPVDPREQKEVLRFLSQGVRGFYARFRGEEPVVLEPGDEFFSLP